MLAISDISINKLKNGKLKKELPEIYELREVIENNDWHSNQSVFDHTILVLEELEKLLEETNNKLPLSEGRGIPSGKFVFAKVPTSSKRRFIPAVSGRGFAFVKNKINSSLNQKVDNHTRKELLFLGALFHDIGKKETMVKKGEWAECPKYKHEKYGSVKVKNILKRIDLSKSEKDIVIQIVRRHGDIHYILDQKNEKLDEQYQNFKSNLSDIFLEMMLLGYADTLGGQLKDNDPEGFKFKINFYNKVINNF